MIPYENQTQPNHPVFQNPSCLIKITAQPTLKPRQKKQDRISHLMSYCTVKTLDLLSFCLIVASIHSWASVYAFRGLFFLFRRNP